MSARLRRAAPRLRTTGRLILQTAVAAGLSWLLAVDVFGFTDPFFAPIAAAIALGITHGRRNRRTLEMVVGVAVGIAVGDLLILWVGTGAWQLGLVVGLAMVAATLLSRSGLLATQAAVSASLVATLQPPTEGLVPYRFFHALLGGAVAVVVAQVLLPLDPVRIARQAAAPVFDRLQAVLRDNARALADGDLDRAVRALDAARAIDPQVRQLHETLATAQETARMAPTRRGGRRQIDSYELAATQVDLAVRNTRVLARGTVALLRLDDDDHPEVRAALGEAVDELAEGVGAVGEQLLGGAEPDETRRRATQAAGRVRAAFPDARAVAVGRIVGQVRSTAIDLLRCSGLDLDEAQRTVDGR